MTALSRPLKLLESGSIPPRKVPRFRVRKWFDLGSLVVTVFLLGLLITALFPRLISKSDPIEVAPELMLLPPNFAHPFGTDQFGRDILSRVAHGARISLGFAAVSTMISLSVSVAVGTTAGYIGGRVDNILMRTVDVLMAFPGILLALMVVFLLGPGMIPAVVAVGVGQTPAFGRVLRAATLAVRSELYIEAAHAMGASRSWILRRHIFPNVRHTVLVLATLGLGGAMLVGSSLSFLGLGVQPPTPEWGSMLGDARSYFRSQWWIATLPGAVLGLTLLSLNVFGDRVRDLLDPKLRVG